MNACLKTAGWLGAALPMFAAMIDVTPAQAQSSARELPAVVVDQPSRPPAARSRPAPKRQAASATSRRAAQRGQTPPDAAAAAGARAETATGPVRGYLANQSGTGTKTDTPLRETPQSITVVTADRVTDQGALTVQEALRYVPGVFADAYGLDSRGDYPRIRGQDPNIYLDGTRVVNTWQFNEWRPDPYTLERIEVLRGPASVLYGDTSTAGLLNLVSKRPQAEAFNEIGVQFGSFNRKQVQIDSTGKLTKDGEWLYRFVGVLRDSGMQTDFVPDDRIVLAPSLTWRPTNNTNWTVLGTYQKDNTGSSTAFLPHEGTLYPGPNGLIPVQPVHQRSGLRQIPDRNRRDLQPVRAQLQRRREGSAEPSLHACRRHLPVGLSERLLRSVHSAKSEFSVSRSVTAHRGALYLEPRNQQGQFHLGQQRRAEIRHRAGAPQDAGRPRLPRPQGARAIRQRLRHHAVRPLRAGL